MNLQEGLAQLRVMWGQLSLGQRAGLAGAVVAAAVALAVLVSAAQSTDYTVAYTNLSPQDGGQIVNYLTSQKILYQLADDGKTIKVPSRQVDQVRLALATQNLPTGGQVGYEIFDKTGLAALGQTDFTQRVAFQRALEGELARTIGQYPQIQQVRVHLVIPEQQLFTQQQQDTTAAVMVQLRPGQSLSAEQIRGMINLVSKSVQGLKPSNVVVVDVGGRVLSDDVSLADATTQSLSRLQLQRMVEKNVQTDILDMLNTVIGPNKAVIRVNADLDWDQVEQNNTLFDPPQTVPATRPNVLRSQQTTTQTFGGPASQLPGGVPGAPSNVVPSSLPPGATPGGQPVAYDQSTTTSNYEISQSVEKVVKAPGAIKRLDVAVMLDGPMDPDRVQVIEKTVATAAGIQPARGDAVTVAAMPFDRTYFDQQRQQMQQAAQLDFYDNLAKIGGAIVITLLLLFFLRMILLRRSGGDAEPLEAGASYEEIGPGGAHRRARTPRGEALSAATEVPEILSPEEERIREMKERLQEMQQRRRLFEEQVFNLAKNQPEAVAQLIRDWVMEAE